MTNDRDWIGRPKSQDDPGRSIFQEHDIEDRPEPREKRPYRVMSPFAGGVILGVAFGVAAGAVLAVVGVVLLRLLAS